MTGDELNPTEEPEVPPAEQSSSRADEDSPLEAAAELDAVGEEEPQFDEREDLFDFEEFVLENAGVSEEDDFNLDELLDAISTISDGDGEPIAESPIAEASASVPEKMDAELLQQILAAQQQLTGDDEENEGAAPLARRPGPPLSLVAIAAVIVMTMMNAGVVSYSWLANRDIKDEMLRFADDVIAVTEQIRDDTSQQVRDLEALQGPITSRDPEYSRTFDKVRELIDAGEHLEARRQLYSLLAVLDRLEEEVRADAEARACFLLGDTLRLEAIEREAGRDPR